MALRRLTRRGRKTRRLFRRPRRLSVKAPPVRKVYKDRKKMRRYNKGSMALQSRMQSGSSLPEETRCRFVWRGSCVINVTGRRDQNQTVPNSNGQRDQCFVMNDIWYPYGSRELFLAETNYRFHNMSEPIAYQSVWAKLYKECLVTGSKLTLRISRPAYPQYIAHLKPSHGNEWEGTGPGAPGTIGSGTMMVPTEAMYGFWYLRVHYTRNGGGYSPETVGHDPLVSQPWGNMREFMQDASVSYKRDKLPKYTKMGYLGEQSDTTLPYGATLTQSAVPLFASGGAGRQPYYEIQLSNMPVKWTHTYSARKHLGISDLRMNLTWQALQYETYPPQTPSGQRYTVKFGYVAFDDTGTVCYACPIDRIPQRQVEAEIQYHCLLRKPTVRPWDYTIPDGQNLGRIAPDTSLLPEQDLETQFSEDGNMTDDTGVDDVLDGPSGDLHPSPLQP